MKRVAIFASGNGSNAENIIKYFLENDHISIDFVLTNNTSARVLERAAKFNIPSYVFKREQFYKTEEVLNMLLSKKIDFVVLAGFMCLVPVYLVNKFPQAIINIHPALLPKYGGKGMYGNHVHQAVFDAKEKESGITIHYVNDKYDEGDIIFQKSISINANDDPDSIADKVHDLEYEYLPKVIEELLMK